MSPSQMAHIHGGVYLSHFSLRGLSRLNLLDLAYEFVSSLDGRILGSCLITPNLLIINFINFSVIIVVGLYSDY